MDRDSIKQQITLDSLSPLHFLNDGSREQFWQVVARCQLSLEERSMIVPKGEKYSNLPPSLQQQNARVEIERLNGIIERQEIDLKNFSKQLSQNESKHVDYLMLQQRFEEVNDELDIAHGKNEELTLRLEGLEQAVLMYHKDKEANLHKVMELTSLLHNRSVDAQHEK